MKRCECLPFDGVGKTLNANVCLEKSAFHDLKKFLDFNKSVFRPITYLLSIYYIYYYLPIYYVCYIPIFYLSFRLIT